ncbi:transposase [uncultured Croceicoccus sp.]|uniref:IS66 family transposase n=1 Tax=uncultured Croceicoccus sp. TaxID=1295329 RepID=UPI002621AA12|nr:transposase [uncultured Croceicoccus sp.]
MTFISFSITVPPKVSTKSRLDETIRYVLTRLDGLIRFLDDGRIDLDNNSVERSIRPLAPNRKDALFTGSNEGADSWVMIATLIESGKLPSIDSNAWMNAMLTSLANRHLDKHIDQLMPWADRG